MLVLVQAYTKLNVGDDLFLHTLFQRYPKVNFEINVYDDFFTDYRRFALQYRNVKVIGRHSLMYRIKNKLGISDIERGRLKKYDAVVNIAGSIFMENTENTEYDDNQEKEISYLFKKKIPVFFLSCNFGPYYTQDYKRRKEEMFKKCTDVCFRDKYSYDQFAKYSSVRYAPDAVFTMELPTVVPKKHTLGISVIDLISRGKMKKFYNDYKELIIKLICDYASEGYEIYLFSFCKIEGDEDAVDDIMYDISDCELEDRVHKVCYDGRLTQFLNTFLSMERMVCTRFHSMVLAVMGGIPMLPLVYSSKVSNVIDDLGLCKNVMQINDLWGSCEMNKPIKTEEIVMTAEKMFEKLDKLLLG